MDPVSSTSNFSFKKRFLNVFLFVLFFYLIDLAIFESLFKSYDKFYNLSDALKSRQILLIGSSHVLWDLDSKTIEKDIGKTVSVINIPGANMEIRYEFLRDYLERFKDKPPELLVLETDRFLFHSSRYPENTYKSILGYYHKGLYQAFFREKVLAQEGFVPYLAFLLCKSFSFNNYFHYLGASIYDKYIGKIITIAYSYIELEKAFAIEREKIEYSPEEKKRIEDWKKLYNAFDNTIHPKSKFFFDQFVALANKHNIKLILLDTPNFDFGDEDRFENVREIFISTQNEKTHYVRLSPDIYEKNLKYLHDASHLNFIGRSKYTEEFVNRLKNIK